ncbi:TPA: hypothetical protein ACX6RU_000610 [Photobacterium damselae]
MMSHLLKKLICNLIFTLFFICAQMSYAMTIQGRIEDGTVQWDNAIYQGGYLTLSDWKTVSGLRPTKAWKPGTFMSVNGISDGKITLSNGSSSVSIPFEIAGTQYGLGDAAGKFDIEDGSGMFTECPQSSLSSNMAYVIGSGAPCSSKDMYKTKEGDGYTPFQFARPLFDIEESKIIEAFNDQTLTKGVYTGTVIITPMYMFTSPTGSWTFRTTTISLNIALSYSGSQILDYEVIGDGIITPTYNIGPQTITGATQYQVKFNGVFSEGSKINMKLLEPASGIFELQADDKSTVKDKNRIPYSIKCKGNSCKDDVFVDFSGKLQLSGGLSYLEAVTDTRQISFILELAYKDIPRTSVETGRYSNSFTIIFESDI